MKACFVFLQALAFAIASPSRSLPSFTLHEERLESGAPKVAITFPNGEVDNLILSQYISHEEDRLDEEENCNFVGHLEDEKEACVAMTGCIGKEPVEFTILSKKLDAGKYFKWQLDGRVDLIKNPLKDGKFKTLALHPRDEDGWEEVGDEMINDAKVAEEQAQEFNCIQSGKCSLPEKMLMTLRIGYGRKFLEKFGGEPSNARNFITATLAHSQVHFCHESLGTKLEIKRQGDWLPMKMMIRARGKTLRRLFPTVEKELNGASLMSFFGHDTGGDWTAGIAWIGVACDPDIKWAANINEWISDDASVQGGLLSHEIGHNLGMLHDFDKYHGGSDGPCDHTGIMSYGVHPEQWSECSKNDFQAHYRWYKKRDMWCMGNTTDSFTC